MYTAALSATPMNANSGDTSGLIHLNGFAVDRVVFMFTMVLYAAETAGGLASVRT